MNSEYIKSPFVIDAGSLPVIDKYETERKEFLAGVADYGTVAPVPSRRDPAKARAARTRTKHDRWAQEMREAGWVVSAPDGAGQQ